MDLYLRKILRVSVAQICQTIGYNSIQSIPLELLIDSLHKFLQEFARDLHRHVELFNRTEANLDDVALSLHSLNISVNDLLEYINHVQPVACNIDIPELPATKLSNLNFLKPGSKEVLTRPVHIYEHLPPILRDSGDVDDKSNIGSISLSPNSSSVNVGSNVNSPNEISEDICSKLTGQQLTDLNDISNAGTIAVENNSSTRPSDTKRKSALDSTVPTSTSIVQSSATREISSVMMTSGGFISPAIEGRIPECLIPEVVDKYFGLDAPPSAIPPAIVAPQMPAPSLNPSSTAGRTSIKHEDSTTSSTGLKITHTVDKKLLKKVKKKSMASMVSPIAGTTAPVPNEKAGRKLLKIIQKAMAKNGTNAINGTYKTKNSNSITQGSQDKYLKKKYKIKQKQNRHQYVQKQMEAALSATPNISNGGRGQSGQIYSHSNETGSNSKQKKDHFVVPAQMDEMLALESDVSNSFLKSSTFPTSKGMYHNLLSGSQDIKLNLLTTQNPQPNLHGPPSPQYDEVKLSNEPDRSKLNIFKKISTSGRKERADAAAASSSTNPIPSTTSVQLPTNTDVTPVSSSASTTIFSDDQVISLPSGTTITPAPPSGSGRHVYAPPPSTQAGDFDSIISVDDDGSIPEGSAVLMQRGDLMIHKPKKRGRKPGSKNQPKVLGINTKKIKKIKKAFFNHHSNSNLLEPLNLSHSSIANIANIPLGIASTFPIDSDAALKLKKDRKKAKLGKDTNFIRNSGKSPSARNLAPTKEEFASINQKLMMMDTVLQPAPPLPPGTHSPSMNKITRSNSPSLGDGSSFSLDQDSVVKVKKERKKTKQIKDQKLMLQQGTQSISSSVSTNKTSIATGRKSPSSYTTPNFPGVPTIGNLPMFPFYPQFAPRPGLIPSHNLFSQMPNMHNNAFGMAMACPLMGFRPLNPPISSFLKDEKEPTPPLIQVGEGNYSKVAPLVPDTMKLELSPASATPTSSPGVPGPKIKTASISSTTSMKTARASPSTQTFTTDSSIASSIPSALGSAIHFSEFRKRSDEHASTVVSSSSGSLNVLKNSDVTIEVSSDDSIQDEKSSKPSSLTYCIPLPSGVVSSTSGIRRQSHPSHDFAMNDDVNIVEDSDTSLTEQRNKEHKKSKKLGKQGKKQLILSGSSDSKNPGRVESCSGVSTGFPDDLCSVVLDITSESGKKNDESANTSNHTALEYGISPERISHKKMKKLLKESKLKKKKDKKDKNKNKDRTEKIVKSEKYEKRKEEKKDKDKLKKLKKDRKKEKQRTDMDITTVKYISSGEGTGSTTDLTTIVPKLTLKLGQSSQSPTPLETNDSRKSGSKLSLISVIGTGGSIICSSEREPSPELARISPLVTRPPKQKTGIDDSVSSSSVGTVSSAIGANTSLISQSATTSHQTPSLSASLNITVESVIDIDSNSGGPTTSMLPASATILGLGMTTGSNNSSGSSVMVASSTSGSTVPVAVHSGSNQSNQNQHQTPHQHISSNKHSAAVPLISEANRPSSYIDAEGNRVWICPACGKVDDGSAMIGCDGCDAWYHWVCVGIFVAPNDNEDWYCRVCIAKKRGMHGGDRKRKRNKKKNINS